MHRGRSIIGILAMTLAGCGVADRAEQQPVTAASEPLERPAWADTANTAKPWTRWWWPGSAVDEESLTRQLESLAEAGIGGVEITPIYGARGYEDRYIEFLSPDFMAMLEHVGREARRLELGVDMATGTGWPFGGPWVEESDALARAVLRDGALSGAATGMLVKRAAPGGEGLVVNPYSPAALERYLDPFTAAFADFPNGLLRGQFHDSFEYYDASFAPELPEVFHTLHGYDIEDYAAELLGESPMDEATLGRIKSDFRQTLDRMHRDYLAQWRDWSHAHGMIVRNQSHGAPANLLDLYGMVDIPETEVFGSTPYPIPGLRRDAAAVRHDQDLPEPLVTRMASSAAHVMGKLLASSETATWLRDHFKVTLAYVKPELDRILLDGINHVFYHGTVYSPQDAPWPGWLFYASTQFNPNNSWWDDFGALNAYVERVQKVLQGGRPDNRVLLYWPVYDIWDDPVGLMQQLTVHDVGFIMDSPTGELARTLDNGGFAFDYISDDQIAMTTLVEGRLRTPGNDYDVIVIPRSERMPLGTLQRLVTLAEDGARIVFEALPADVPGFGDLEQRQADFQALLAGLDFEASPAEGVERFAAGSGEILKGDVLAALEASGTVREALAATPVDFVRRRTASGYDYFLANLEAESFSGWVTLGVPAEGAVITDPLTGRSGRATLDESKPSVEPGVRVWLQLEPGESLLVSTLSADTPDRPDWTWFEPVAEPVPVAGEWSIEFVAGGPEMPSDIATNELRSWTEIGDEAAERFAGTARYTIEFDAPAADVEAWRLDLGDVRDSARVRLNGREIGTAWSLPSNLVIRDGLAPEVNVLEIEVTNVAANRIRDMDRRGVDWKIMREINFVNIRYEPFDASDWPIEPAGLLGPIELVPLERVRFDEL